MTTVPNNLKFSLDTNAVPICVDSVWTWGDYCGAIKVRSTLKRNNYLIDPGLYIIGQPTSDNEVFISANYKLSFDILRKNLKGINAWILVLDSKGVNVWCAAGKGTFGTDELLNRIYLSGIMHRINHKRIIVPQLGAPGISAHKIKKATGLKVIYGPVRAKDLKAFLENNLQATPEMRKVEFPFKDRFTLAPVEVVYSGKYLLLTMVVYFLISAINKTEFSYNLWISNGISNSLLIMLGFFTGTLFGPLLLPVLPFRPLALKGLFSGLLFWLILYFTYFDQTYNMENVSYLFTYAALGSFFTMNFTGATTYTSLSGVKLEMKYAIPLQILIGVTGLILFIISKFV